jgi:hypothetical protein
MRWKVSLTVAVAVVACAAGVTAAFRADSHHRTAGRAQSAHIRPAEVTAREHMSRAVAANAKKGVSVWTFSGVRKALARSGPRGISPGRLSMLALPARPACDSSR